MFMRRAAFFCGLLVALVGLILLLPRSGHAQSPGNPTLYPPGQVIIPLTPTVFAQATPIGGCFAPLPFAPGDEIGIRGGVNIRSAPSASSAQLNIFELPITMFVVEGPVCADGFNWWKVRGTGTPGWVAEGRPDFYFVNLVTDASNPDPCIAPLDIRVGENARVLYGVRVRQEPSEDALVLTVAAFQSIVPVVAGPVCSGGLNYWQIQSTLPSGQVVTGWATEGPDWGYYLEPELRPLNVPNECFRPLSFVAGDRVIVRSPNAEVRFLRAEPSEHSALISELIGGVQLEVLEGSVCVDNFNWWRVRVIGSSAVVEGWVAEGTPPNGYFLREIRPTSLGAGY
jgi:hypothetical protein